jgi:eukaryotic-like serine/threonine-protein kinase
MVGTTLGHYRIVSLLGKGGMGEVYAADDLKLGRRVAVKILPPALISGPQDLERLEREARAVAALNHPGIVTLYSFEESSGTRFLTMELVHGHPLSEHLPAGGWPTEKLLDIGTGIADAVSAAHDKGVVHRDLKPGNVLLTESGQIKILDFGLARLREPELPANAELPTQQLTSEGHIVGTVAYMSPEQAEGKLVDHRSDIFSIGVVLYELATGRRPFTGDTNISVLSSLLKDTPKPASEINPAVPGSIARVLRTCLQKDPERRFQSAKDLRNELRTLREEIATGETAAPAVVASRRTPATVPILGGLLLASLAVIGYLLVDRGRDRDDVPALRHRQITSAAGSEIMPNLSPDGKWLVYVAAPLGNADILLQAANGQTAINLTKDSAANDIAPVFSPDGERILFRSGRDGGGLYVMGRTGEAPRRVSSDGVTSSWSPDGSEIVVATASASDPINRTVLSSLRVVRLDTGATRVLLEADGMNPDWSPNGRFIAYWGLTSEQSETVRERDLWVIPAAGGSPWRITNDPAVDWCPQWSPDGRFLYFASDRGGTMNVWRIAMDPGTGRTTGSEPEALTTPAPFVADLNVSRNGASFTYTSRMMTRNIHRRAFDVARLAVGPAEPVTTGSKSWYSVDPSPDGTQLVLSSYQPREDIYISRADGSELRQLTTDEHYDRFPRWSPDGKLIAFYSNRSGKYEVWTVTLGGELRQLTEAADYSAIYPRWSPDGRSMLFEDVAKGALVLFDPWKPWREQKPDVLPAVPRSGSGAVTAPLWSPDGTKVALSEAGRILIYDVAKRTYEPVMEGAGLVDWYPDGRLIILRPDGLQIFDPVRRTASAIAIQSGTARETPVSVRLSRDGRMMYYVQPDTQADIWIVEQTVKR